MLVRRRRLIGQAALVGALVVLAFPADGSALRAVFVKLTPTGPAPIVLTLPAGLYPVWINQDQVPHTVVFANGLCSLQVAPGEAKGCSNAFSEFVGYPYTVDGTVQASIVVVPESRDVTLTASCHRIQRGARLTLHGQVTVPVLPPPAPPSPQTVTVLARLDSRHPFRRVAVVVARPHGWQLLSQLRVRPRATTTYIVEANSQPTGGRFWQQARSRPFKVLVTR
ncbi:MAG: hypothetical protein ACXVRV_05865 [Gaiellaceae bacterium]